MNQNDQMREALREVLAYCDELGVELGSVRFFAEQDLNHTPDTGKMVRLTLQDIEKLQHGDITCWDWDDTIIFANAIQDAMEKLNGGAHATD